MVAVCIIIGIGVLAMIGAMVGFVVVVTMRPSSDRPLIAWATVFVAILALVFLVMGGHMWGRNSATENAQGVAATERK